MAQFLHKITTALCHNCAFLIWANTHFKPMISFVLFEATYFLSALAPNNFRMLGSQEVGGFNFLLLASIDIVKPLSSILSGAVNKSQPDQEKNSWECRESNLWLLGEKQVCYLCAMPPP